jgi:Fe-S-cluster containining protein
MNKSFREAVMEASARPEVREAVQRTYADVQAEIDRRRPVCVASGRCCRFEEYGHRLFVTTAEMATFVHDLASAHGDGEASVEPNVSCAGTIRLGGSLALPQAIGPGCPFQEGKLCSVHNIRPFGCRIFFCDATATEWQQEQYERFHARLKRLHGEMDVPYSYMEWRAALATVLESGV